ncbi:DDE superendonuclease family protein [Orientia tsutsugamushi str. Gilliam]|uniref:DDE superendonuclease family protein n=1 Tax=Orientia tsutsugamushi str. Gilliam TaxID=1359184 RepID=A0A0F3MCL8_ORITS|nr:DDE superendonuclease family protein [Orientia tsutsugamushi str. Gilliam]
MLLRTPIERHKKKQKFYYSGKKKRHTLKTQIVVYKKTYQVICTDFSNSKKHDCRLFKKSKILIHPKVKAITDIEYQSIQKIYNNSELPKKKSKKNPLTKNDKKIIVVSRRKSCI